MKSIIKLAAAALSLSSASAFVSQSPTTMRTASSLLAAPEMTPELESAIAEVREAAATFGDKTAHFANGTSWSMVYPPWLSVASATLVHIML